MAGLSRTVLAVTVVLALAACATTGTDSVPTQSVEERAQQRWAHLVERDFEAAWALHTPGFRQTTNAADFSRDMARRPIRWLSATVQSADCEADRCEVVVAVTYQAIAAPSGQRRLRLTRPVEETWVRLDGEWWFVQN